MRKMGAFIFLVFTCFLANAQWKKVKFIDKPLTTISATPEVSTIFVGTSTAEIGRSIDGGIRFEFRKLESEGYIEDFLFENEKIGYAAGGCMVDTIACAANTIFKTTDAGTTWDYIHKSEGIGKIIHLQKTEDGRLFGLSEFEGIYFSDDDKTFQKVIIDPTLTKGSFVNFQMFENGIGYISHNFKTRKRLYKTQDNGETWFNIFESELPNFTAEFHFANPDLGFLKMAKGAFFKTEDGGSTWTQNQVTSELQTINQIEFLSDLKGYFISRNGGSLRGNLFRTEDGGLSWNQELGMEKTFWSDLHLIDENQALAIVDNNKILKRFSTETLDNNTIKAYPNPFKEDLTIRMEYYYKNYVLEIYDSFSRLVAKERMIDFENVLDGSFFKNGYYYMRILKDDLEIVHSQGFVKM